MGKKKRRKKKRCKPSEKLPVKRDPLTPYWVPDEEFFEHLPEKTKQAICEVLNPAYRQLVLEAPDELQRSAGLTLVHLIWLEIIDQLELAEGVADRNSIFAIAKDPEALLGRHLRLVATKCKVTELLMKVRLFHKMIATCEDTVLLDSHPTPHQLPRNQPTRLLAHSGPAEIPAALPLAERVAEHCTDRGIENGKSPSC